jgi:hypothetical protein
MNKKEKKMNNAIRITKERITYWENKIKEWQINKGFSIAPSFCEIKSITELIQRYKEKLAKAQQDLMNLQNNMKG